jgi:hypothetical protein
LIPCRKGTKCGISPLHHTGEKAGRKVSADCFIQWLIYCILAGVKTGSGKTQIKTDAARVDFRQNQFSPPRALEWPCTRVRPLTLARGHIRKRDRVVPAIAQKKFFEAGMTVTLLFSVRHFVRCRAQKSMGHARSSSLSSCVPLMQASCGARPPQHTRRREPRAAKSQPHCQTCAEMPGQCETPARMEVIYH